MVGRSNRDVRQMCRRHHTVVRVEPVGTLKILTG